MAHPDEVFGGVDTHRDTLMAAVADARGVIVATHEVPTTSDGYQQLLVWLSSFGRVVRVGIEGAGSYGAGLHAYLRDRQVVMVEVDRPNRQLRRQRGKSDTIDAEAAARAAWAGGAHDAEPKSRDGIVEAIRTLRVARRSALKARTQARSQLKAVIVTAPDTLRSQLRTLNGERLLRRCARLRVRLDQAQRPEQATRITLRSLARRSLALGDELRQLDALLLALIQQRAPRLLELPGVGVETAGQLLTTAGDNPHRLRSEAAFAHLAGVAPIPASSGRRDRHRLNRGGDRQANAALHRIVITRLSWHPQTRAYLQRRTQQGLTKRDAIRCLKRYAARELYPHLLAAHNTP